MGGCSVSVEERSVGLRGKEVALYWQQDSVIAAVCTSPTLETAEAYPPRVDRPPPALTRCCCCLCAEPSDVAFIAILTEAKLCMIVAAKTPYQGSFVTCLCSCSPRRKGQMQEAAS